VGKTSILLRHDGQGFTSLMSSTLGASYVCSKSSHAGREVKLQIWDTAGQERFRSMVPMYLRSAAAAILVFDITNKHSFDDLDSWICEVSRSENGSAVSLFILGNKCDLERNRCVSEAEGREFATRKGAHYFETSALSGKGIETTMVLIAEEVLHQMTIRDPSTSLEPPSPGIHLHTSPWVPRHQSRKNSTAEEDSEGSISSVKGHKNGRYGWCCGFF